MIGTKFGAFSNDIIIIMIMIKFIVSLLEKMGTVHKRWCIIQREETIFQTKT